MRYVVKTLGCKANLQDSQILEAEMQKRGWAAAAPDASEEGDVGVCIVNSCTVTDEADKQSRRMAERLARQYPNARVVLTGCSAEVHPEKLLQVKGLSYVVGNRDKSRMVEMLGQAIADAGPTGGTGAAPRILGVAEGYREIASRHPMDREWPLPDTPDTAPFDLRTPSESAEYSQLRGNGSARTRAFLKVQEGCNSFCTFCIIPYGRGPSRSLRPRELVETVRRLVSQGVREVVVTGTNIGQYGTDWNGGEPATEELTRMLLGETALERLRLSSLDPTEITPGMLELMEQDPRLCPHFHVSLQSPHPRILKLMKRKHGFEAVEECLTRIAEVKAPPGGVFVGMDLITGFPGEGEEEYQWTLEALRRLPWSRLHVFPYSEREGTPATRLKGSVYPHVRKERCKELSALSLERLESIARGVLDHCRSTGEPLRSVLLEGPARGPDGTRNWISGYTPNYFRVLIRTTPDGPDTWRTLENSVVDITPSQVLIDRASGDVSFVGSDVQRNV